MQLGFVGLGKMGSRMVERLLKVGHYVVVYDRSQYEIEDAAEKGAVPSNSLEDMVSKLPDRKIIWLMVPSGTPVDENVDKLIKLLHKNDIIIDGGNSQYKHSMARAEKTADHGIYFLDCGTSGGVWGLQNGYSLMSGGEKEPSEYVLPIFKTLAPEGGYTYCGRSGSGHFVKMVHNGIEYGMMESIAEGFEILSKSPFDLNLKDVASGWRYGSVIQSWLLELMVKALKEDPGLRHLQDYVDDSGEGRWTVDAAMELNVPAHVITTALFNRYRSREKESFAMKVLAALRNQFGGHAVKRK